LACTAVVFTFFPEERECHVEQTMSGVVRVLPLIPAVHLQLTCFKLSWKLRQSSFSVKPSCCVQRYSHARTHTYAHIHASLPALTHTRTHSCAHTHTHVHTYTHIQLRTCTHATLSDDTCSMIVVPAHVLLFEIIFLKVVQSLFLSDSSLLLPCKHR
jgi:hypothetical protein